MNTAALTWAQTRQLAEGDWQAAVHTVLHGAFVPDAGCFTLGARRIDYRAVPLDDAWVLWLSPGAAGSACDDVPARADAARILSLVTGFVDIGCFEHDTVTGQVHWDAGLFRIFGLEPTQRALHFDEALQRLHPHDRARVRAQRERTQLVDGRQQAHFRVLQPDGRMRHVHAFTEVRRSAEGPGACIFGVLVDETASAARMLSSQREKADLARALELAMISVWRIDLQTQRIHYNDIGYRITGVAPSPEGMSLQQMRALAHPDDLPAILDAAAQAMASDGVVDVEARYRNADGSWRHLLTRRVAERDAQGQVVALAGVSLDQTRQIAARDHAQALARRIQRIADAAGVGVWSIEGEHDQVHWNAQMFRIYGLPEDGPTPPASEWMGQRVQADDRKRVADERRRARRNGSAGFETEFRVVRPDGSLRWVVCRSHGDVHDGRAALYGIHLDVTLQRQTDQALRLHEQRLKLATQTAGMGSWERDVASREVLWDEQMYRLRGLRADDPRTPRAIDTLALAPEALAERSARIERHLRDGTPFEYEFQVRWPDGTLHWLASTGHAVLDEAAQPLRMVGLNWDITQRRLAERARRDKESAERASRAKSEFLARMSHELRTPLNAILGFAQLIQQDTAEPPDARQQRERAARIHSAGTHLLSLIDDVLDLATSEAGAPTLALEALALDEALDDVQHWLRTLAARHAVELHVPASGAQVMAEPRRLRQVLANLLSNAIKYNHAGGRAWVEVKPSKHLGTAGWLLSVHDDGRGLSPAQLAHLFEPFNRLGAEREAIEGRGIGLATAHQLARLMGSQLRARSRVGAGSEFYFRLAAAAPSAAMQPAKAARAKTTLSLLYVEDNPVNVLVMQELVALRPGFAFSSAEDGQSGVRMALRDKPDLVLVDMQLPDIDGYEVLRVLREQHTASTLIALSANAMPDDIARAKAAGFDDYWTKPIDFENFLGALEQLAKRRQRTRRTSSTRPSAKE